MRDSTRRRIWSRTGRTCLRSWQSDGSVGVLVGGSGEEFQHRPGLAREVVAGVGEQTHV
jgi:hypothetical protein